jgi:hypothetical protein
MEPRISLDSVVVASRDQVSCPLEDEIAILHLKAGVYYGLDAVGARVWGLVAAPRSVRAIRDTLLVEYDVEPEQCERDLVALLGDLLRAGLVDIQDAGPS